MQSLADKGVVELLAPPASDGEEEDDESDGEEEEKEGGSANFVRCLANSCLFTRKECANIVHNRYSYFQKYMGNMWMKTTI